MAITFQDTILRLQDFWASRGCLVWQPVNTEVGAGTMNPATFLRVLGPEPWHVAYVEPSVRPDDSRYGENPNRIQTHTQFQVILKPGPDDPQQVYLDSLAAIGIDTAREDIRFVEDNWQQPALGAWGLGWEVWLDGLEITQFTYFQQAGGIALDPVAVEITYGLERIVMSQQGARRFQDIEYAPGITYGDALGRSEYEWSVYYLDQADVDRTRQLFALHEQEARALIGANLALPAYGQLLRTSHLFNVLDARGAVGVAERAAYFARMRELARTISELWLGTEPPPRPAPNPPAPREQAALPPVEGARELLLELGVEELPPADLDAALRHLRTAAPAELERRRLEADAIEVHGTPRRIVLTAAGLRTGAAELVRGPAWHVAFGEDGTPSKAGEGFARKHGIAASELVQVEHGGQVFAGATASQGADVRTAAADAAEALLNGIPYARGMRWNESQVLFARPARWIAALLGDDVLPVRFAGLTAGRTTRALRGTEPVELATAADHAPALAAAGIVLDETEREARIAARAGELAAEAGGGLAVAPGDPLMGEVTNLVEAPTPLLGSIDAEFVELPDPVLATVMRRHQRYLPIERDGALLPAFVVVANGEIDAGGVRAGNEAVLRARFADARFFIAQDEQRSLEDFRADLDGIVFEEKLGSMLEKSRRQERLTAELAPLLLAGEEQRATAIRAAALGRADLATQMVTEMTSLAGTMGGIYARAQGLPEDVAAAIEEHVRPAYAGDRLPRTDAGAVAGLADRIDSLTGLMAAGHAASSTSDPFGLRRAALGILQIAVGRGLDVDLADAVRRAAALQPVPAGPEVQAAVVDFLWRRFEVWRRELGEPADVVRAAVRGGKPSPPAKVEAIAALQGLAADPEFAALHETWMRSARLARRQPVEGPVDPALLAEPAEQALHEGARIAADAIAGDRTVDGVVAALTPLAPLITAFFEQVFVMVEDEALARNRLALVRDVAALPAPVADLAELGESLAAPAAV